MKPIYRAALLLLLILLGIAPLAAGGRREAGSLVSPQEALRMVESGSAILVDVRDEGSYVEAHLAGAILVPLDQVPARAQVLAAQGKTVITYCSCPAEETSKAAASELIRAGVTDVLVLRGGIRGWVAAGLPMRSGTRP
jgi:rhodanese-related sulfurtransferase